MIQAFAPTMPGRAEWRPAAPKPGVAALAPRAELAMTSTGVRDNTLGTIALAGVAGCVAIDLYLIVTHGLIFHDATALEVSQWDASNALGLSAFSGGLGTALLGLGMHLCVSLVWAAIYVFAARAAPALLRHPWLAGTVFGVVVWFAMRYLVVPLGHAHAGGFSPAQFANQGLAHILAFGIPVALIVSARTASRVA
jgi:hypothetical protein